VAQVFVNLSNSYDKKEFEPEMVELAKYAKQHVPEEHEKVRISISASSAEFFILLFIHSFIQSAIYVALLHGNYA